MSPPVLPRGANLSLQPALAQSPRLTVRAVWSGEPPKQHSVDIVAIVVNADGKAMPDGMLTHSHFSGFDGAFEVGDVEVRGEDRQQLVHIATNKVPESVQRIAIALIVQVAGHVRSIKSLSNIKLSMLSSSDVICESEHGTQGPETAMVLGEVYRRNGEWKFKHIGQGFQGGMRALADSFGLTAADAALGGTSHSGERGSATLATAPENIITIKPPAKGTLGEVQLQLTWAATVPTPVALAPKGGLSRLLGLTPGTPQNLDLDLCCLYELSDGHRGVVQALGENYGAFNIAPYLQLMGDERQGTNASETGEVLRLNGARLHELHRVIVYAMIFSGPANWSAAKPKLAVRVGEDLPINIRPVEADYRGRVMALAYLENKDGVLTLHKLSESYGTPRELDEAYHWGLRWTAGRKD